MDKYYTVEKHTRILIALMKFHGVRKIVASPGTTNICLVGSLQNDPYFEIYSSVDERSAAYIACGLARESGEPVALSCTGATASRNYIPGLTEAFYSNLPVLAITSTQHLGRVGQLMPQVIDRTNQMNDMVKKSVQVDVVHTLEDEWAAQVSINDALLELRCHGGGPVHINLVTTYSSNFSVRKLPKVTGICRYFLNDDMPSLIGKKILIDVGAHARWTRQLTDTVDLFCEKYNAAVICEHISNYRGKYGVYPHQIGMRSLLLKPDIMIHIGTVEGFGAGNAIKMKEVWRVHPDGQVRDTFKSLTKVFEMQEIEFFEYYCILKENSAPNTGYYTELYQASSKLVKEIPELPFSNPWIAKNTVDKLTDECELHLGILNSLRSWSFFEIDHRKNISIYSNTGGFGIDGMVSTLLGSSLASLNKLIIGVIGDLAFFYDMNALGNRHINGNIRLMVINNGRGTEFTNYNHPAAQFGHDADAYMAAYGHYGEQSRDLLRHYAEDLGFEYLCAETKEEYLDKVGDFLNPVARERPVVFEIFTDSQDESDALNVLFHMEISIKKATKNAVKSLLGEKGVSTLKKIIKK